MSWVVVECSPSLGKVQVAPINNQPTKGDEALFIIQAKEIQKCYYDI